MFFAYSQKLIDVFATVIILVVFMIAILAVKTDLMKSVTSAMASVQKISCGPAKGRKNNAFTNHLFVMDMNNVRMVLMRTQPCVPLALENLDFQQEKATLQILLVSIGLQTGPFVQFPVMEMMTCV